MPIKAVIRKTDRRYTGWQTFAYVVDFRKQPWGMIMTTDRVERFELFRSVRDWCSQTWGSSVEKQVYLEFKDHSEMNGHWSWDIEGSYFRIFLVSQKDRDWFALRWL